MKRLVCVFLFLVTLALTPAAWAGPWEALEGITSRAPEALRCAAFGPYVGDLDPDAGPHPTPELINSLLDVVVNQLGFSCIMSYGVLNGLDYVVQAASARGIKVIQVIWLGTDESVNEASITRGIQLARDNPTTVVRLSCGSEFRTRHGTTLDNLIRNCIGRVRAAGVTQPITSIDTWWEWCARAWPCQRWDLSNDVDWIGINIFPWWENHFSGLFPCTTAEEAADFHSARFEEVMVRYPEKEVVLTEFGWPAGPDGYRERPNQYTGQQCGLASPDNQRLVIQETLTQLDQRGWSGIVFEAFREPWKVRTEGPAGPFWGVCEGTPPYMCHFSLPLHNAVR